MNAFEAKVQNWPLVRECFMLAGENDFILKVVAKDWDSYQQFLTHDLTSAPNVEHVKTSLGIRVSKFLPGVPVALDAGGQKNE